MARQLRSETHEWKWGICDTLWCERVEPSLSYTRSLALWWSFLPRHNERCSSLESVLFDSTSIRNTAVFTPLPHGLPRTHGRTTWAMGYGLCYELWAMAAGLSVTQFQIFWFFLETKNKNTNENKTEPKRENLSLTWMRPLPLYDRIRSGCSVVRRLSVQFTQAYRRSKLYTS